FAGVMKAVEDERHQAEDVKMDRAGRAPAPHKNKEPDEEVQKRSRPQVVFNRRRSFLGGSNQRGFKRLAVAADSVPDFRPGTHAPEYAGYIRGAMNHHAANRLDVIPLLDPRARAGRIGDHMP